MTVFACYHSFLVIYLLGILDRIHSFIQSVLIFACMCSYTALFTIDSLVHSLAQFYSFSIDSWANRFTYMVIYTFYIVAFYCISFVLPRAARLLFHIALLLYLFCL